MPSYSFTPSPETRLSPLAVHCRAPQVLQTVRVMPAFDAAFDPQLIADDERFRSLWNANTTRYLSAVGLVVLLYDHLLTFTDEYRLVWKAPSSLPKFVFLFNRYLVLGAQLAVAVEMCGFYGPFLSNLGCKHLLFTTTTLGVASIGIADILVLIRVVILWDRNPVVIKLMIAGFLSTFIVQVVLVVLVLINLSPGVVWSPLARMCVTSTASRYLTAVWSVPLSFEALVLLATIINALGRPRAAHVGLIGALYRDGISYFVVLAALRVVNLSLAAMDDPSVTFLGVFLVWALTTTVLNRSLLNLRQAEVNEHVDPLSGRASPFGIALSSGYDMASLSYIHTDRKHLREMSISKVGV